VLQFDDDSRLVRQVSWKGRILGEIKSGKTVDILLDRDDLVCFGAQRVMNDTVVDVKSLWRNKYVELMK